MDKKPHTKPLRPYFSSGPCAKRPGWHSDVLNGALLGRSHRSALGKKRLQLALARTRELLAIPAEYRIAIVPASDTGAVEIALWNLLGARGVDVLAWESFGRDWVNDVLSILQLADARAFTADYGSLPDLNAVDWHRDCVFVWNGTTSGVKVPHDDWIAAEREGLAICDATSAVFAMPIPWHKLDVVTFSWQKVLGGEGAHGMLVLSPRALERLESYTPSWPLPKIFRLTKEQQLIDAVFAGATINTPSMLCVEDYLDALAWAQRIGGLAALIARSSANFKVIEQWVAVREWVEFLAHDPPTRSTTSICLKLDGAELRGLTAPQRAQVPKIMAALLDAEGVAYDINAYRSAPPGLRIWGGATVETGDLEALLPWLDWAYSRALSQL